MGTILFESRRNRSMAEIPTNELDCLLGVFFKEIVKKSGEPYEPDPLLNFIEASTDI